MVMQKRGQAAMEFLMTYGWAILAAVIVIAVLASFGVFSAKSKIPNRCVVSAPFGCNAGIAEPSGVTLEIRNGGGETLTVRGLDVDGCGSPAVLPVAMQDQNLTTFIIGCTLTPEDKFKGDITITYTKSGSALNLTSTGDIVDTV